MIFPLVYVPKFNRKSVYFDGIAATAIHSDKAMNDVIAAAGTIAFWFRFADATAIGLMRYMAEKGGVYYVRANYAAPDVALTSFIYTVGGAVGGGLGALPIACGWHLLTFSWAYPGSALFYVDGVRRRGVAMPAEMASNLGNWVIGGGQGVYMNMYVDEYSTWSKQLADGGVATGDVAGGEVAALYNGGVPTKLDQHAAAADLQLWLRMGDVDTHPTIHDMSGNGRHFTMLNMTADDIVEVTP